MSKYDELLNFSNPKAVYKKARSIYGPDTEIKISTRKDKKYMIYDIYNNKWIHFGQMGYEDYTKHKNEERRMNYLLRASNIKGNWIDNPYSPNNLSIVLLW